MSTNCLHILTKKKKILMVLTSMVKSVLSYSCLSEWYYDLDLWPWIRICIFLLSWWHIVSFYKILELLIQSVSCLQHILSCFPTMWQFDLDLWPPTIKITKLLPLIMVINCTKLYDSGAWTVSFCPLPTKCPYYVMIRPWP